MMEDWKHKLLAFLALVGAAIAGAVLFMVFGKRRATMMERAATAARIKLLQAQMDKQLQAHAEALDKSMHSSDAEAEQHKANADAAFAAANRLKKLRDESEAHAQTLDERIDELNK